MAHVSLLRNAFSMLGRRHIYMQKSSLQYVTQFSYTRTLSVFFNIVRHNSDDYNPHAFRHIASQSKSVIKAKESDDENVIQTIEENIQESPDREYILPSQRRKENHDLLLKKILSCDSAEELWEIYKKHSDVMDDRHLLRILQSLSSLVAKGYEECSVLHENECFQELCLRTFKGSRRMDVTDLVYLLQYLCRLQVPSQSKLVQTVLQLLRHSINDMDIRLIIQLEFLLKKLPLTPLSHGMLMAIPPIMENVLAQEPLSSLSLKHLSQALSICATGKVRNMGLILQELYKRGSIRSGNMAMSIMWSLVEIYLHKGKPVFLSKEDELTREVLLKECMRVFSRNLDIFKIHQIETALGKICVAHENQDIHSYNEQLFNAIAKHVIERKVDITKVAHIIRRFLKLNYLSEDLVNYVVSVAVRHPETVINAPCPMGPLITAITAMPNYDVSHLDAINVILRHPSLSPDLDESSRIPMLTQTLDLLSIDCYYEPYLELLTSKEFLKQYVDKFTLGNVTSKQLLQLNQVFKVFEKSYHRVPDEFLVDARVLKKDMTPTESELWRKLQQIFGDPELFVSGVVTEKDLYFDHLVVIDEEGNPINVAQGDLPSQEITRICDLNIPEHTKRIAILELRASDTYGPKNVLKRFARLDQQLLEASGYKVILILHSVIRQFTVDERTLYIKSLLEKSGVVF